MSLGKRLWSLLLFFVVSALGGVLVAGLLVPGAMATTMASDAASAGIDALPLSLKEEPTAERSRILAADGSVIANIYDENRVIEPLSNIAEVMQKAQIAIEDHRFYEHGAIDLTGTLRAFISNLKGVPQGGSGLTQQVVRLMQVEAATLSGDKAARDAATEATIARKIREMRYAIAMEKAVGKDKILEDYLNINFYGDGAYGVEAAARHYFDTTAAKLTLPEAAMLAGLVQNPAALNPRLHPQMAIERRNTVLDRMAELGWATKSEVAEAKATPFDPKKIRDNLKGCANSNLPFVCQYAEKALINSTPSLAAAGMTPRDRLYRGGLTIKTSLDPKVQAAAQKAVSGVIAPTDPAIAVSTLVEPKTGKIIAMAQSRPEMGLANGQTFYNYAAPNDLGGAGGFQAGSTFKIFVAAAALQEGFGIGTTYDAKGTLNLKGAKFDTCTGPATLVSDWNPHNASGGGYGNIDMLRGAKNSVNTYFIQLEMHVGMCPVLTMAKDLGIELQDGNDLMTHFNESPSFTLGTASIAPLQLAAAYATFAARGVHCDPILITSIKSSKGAEFEPPSANCKQVITPELADSVNYVFQQPYHGGTARWAQVPGVQMAGKTGTLNDYMGVWTMGYTPNLAGAGMLSYDNNPKYKSYWQTHRGYLKSIRLPSGKYIAGSSGMDAGGKVLKPTFQKAMETRPKQSFHAPDQSILRGKQTNIPTCSSISVPQCVSRLSAAGFATKTAEVESELPKGSVVNTSPSGRTGIGSLVTIQVSKGPKPLPPIDPVDPNQPGQQTQPARPAATTGPTRG